MKVRYKVDGRTQAPLALRAEAGEALALAASKGATEMIISAYVQADAVNVHGGKGVHGGADGRFERIQATLGVLFPVSLRQDAAGQLWMDIRIPGALLESADASDESLERLLFEAAIVHARWIGDGGKRQVQWYTPADDEGKRKPITFAKVAEAVGIAPHKREAVSRAALEAGFDTEARFNWSNIGVQSLTNSVLSMIRWGQGHANRPTDRTEYRIGDAIADREWGKPLVALYTNAIRIAAGITPKKGALVAFSQEFDGEGAFEGEA